MRKEYRLAEVCLLFLFALTATAPASVAEPVEPRPGVVYDAGRELGAESLGVSFTIPRGWRGSLAPSGEAFVMEPVEGPAMLLAVADRLSASAALAFLSAPIALSDELRLLPAGELRLTGARYQESYSVAGEPGLVAEVRAESVANGTSIAFFLLTTPEQLARFRGALTAAMDSLVSAEPAPPDSRGQEKAASGGGESVDSWAAYLRGKHIVRFFSGSGYTEEQHLWLCSDGRFLRRFNSGGFGGGASGATQSRYNGVWRATGEGAGGQLVLETGEGTVTYALRWDYDSSRLYLDDRRWLHDRNDRCP